MNQYWRSSGPDLLKQKPGPPDDRIGAKERVAMLKEIGADERE